MPTDLLGHGIHRRVGRSRRFFPITGRSGSGKTTLLNPVVGLTRPTMGEVLLADEPTGDLDEQTEHEIMPLFQEIHARTSVTALLVTHTPSWGAMEPALSRWPLVKSWLAGRSQEIH